MLRRRVLRALVALGLLGGMVLAPAVADAAPAPDEFVTPLFGLAFQPDGKLLVADSGIGIHAVNANRMRLVAELPGVTDVGPITNRDWWALTSFPPEEGDTGSIAQSLYRVTRGMPRPIADLGAFEAAVNPDGGAIDSNPMDLASLGAKRVLVADAAANALLIASDTGGVDWVATLPGELAPTADVKAFLGCPNPPEELAFVCDLPDVIPAESVPTSVAVGPDGAYYVGELKGFPAPLGMSKVWRIEPGARHEDCGRSRACSVVLDGLTSIIDLNFGPDGTLYVTELDEASWLPVEFGGGVGGTVNACDVAVGTCSVLAGELPLPTAVAVSADGTVYSTILSLVPGQAEVISLN